MIMKKKEKPVVLIRLYWFITKLDDSDRGFCTNLLFGLVGCVLNTKYKHVSTKFYSHDLNNPNFSMIIRTNRPKKTQTQTHTHTHTHSYKHTLISMDCNNNNNNININKYDNDDDTASIARMNLAAKKLFDGEDDDVIEETRKAFLENGEGPPKSRVRVLGDSLYEFCRNLANSILYTCIGIWMDGIIVLSIQKQSQQTTIRVHGYTLWFFSDLFFIFSIEIVKGALHRENKKTKNF